MDSLQIIPPTKINLHITITTNRAGVVFASVIFTVLTENWEVYSAWQLFMQQEQEVYRNENYIFQYRYIQSSVLLSAADRISVDFSGIPESLSSCIASCFHLLLRLFSDASSCISHVSSFAFGISPNEGRHSFIWLALLQLSALSSQLSVRKDNTRNNVGFDTEMNSFLS